MPPTDPPASASRPVENRYVVVPKSTTVPGRHGAQASCQNVPLTSCGYHDPRTSKPSPARTNSPGSSVKITNPDVSVSGSAVARGTTQNIARITHKSDLRRILPPPERLHAYREPPRWTREAAPREASSNILIHFPPAGWRKS